MSVSFNVITQLIISTYHWQPPKGSENLIFFILKHTNGTYTYALLDAGWTPLSLTGYTLIYVTSDSFIHNYDSWQIANQADLGEPGFRDF